MKTGTHTQVPVPMTTHDYPMTTVDWKNMGNGELSPPDNKKMRENDVIIEK